MSLDAAGCSSYVSPVDAARIRELVAPIVKGKGARKAVLFGSYARGTADRRSDVDLLIVDDSELRYLDRLGKYFDELSAALPAPVELFVYRQEEIERMKDRPFLRRALEEGVILYER